MLRVVPGALGTANDIGVKMAASSPPFNLQTANKIGPLTLYRHRVPEEGSMVPCKSTCSVKKSEPR